MIFSVVVYTGFLQLVGCLGALRLSEKLLNAYWLLLLLLLIGDAVLGIFWVFKFDRIMHELQPMLRYFSIYFSFVGVTVLAVVYHWKLVHILNKFQRCAQYFIDLHSYILNFTISISFTFSHCHRYRLATEYGTSIDFSELWDRLQNEGRCCGVFGPQDFTAAANRSYPTSCCSPDISDQISISRRPMASAVVFRDDSAASALASQAKANLTELTDLTWSHLVNDNKDEIKTATVCRALYQQGCFDKVVAWLRNTADILFVLGYCVIAFLKLSFLGILRYEIKEMIQKIKLLQQELAAEAMSGDGEAMQQQQTVRKLPISNAMAKINLIEKFNSILICRVVYYCKFPVQQ